MQQHVDALCCLGDYDEEFWVGEKLSELGSSRGRQIKVLWFKKCEDGTYTAELPDIVNPSAVIVEKAQLHVVDGEVNGEDSRYRLRECDREAALAALAERCMAGLSGHIADDAEAGNEVEQ